MHLLTYLLVELIRVYSFILMVRIVIELIQTMARSFRPPRWFFLIAEPIFMVTDPPVKALRKLIPPLRLGNGVALDLSVLVLFFILYLLIAFLPRILL